MAFKRSQFRRAPRRVPAETSAVVGAPVPPINWGRPPAARELPPPVRLVSIDPSARACGWAVVGRAAGAKSPAVESSGVWHPSAARGAARNLEQLGAFVARLIVSVRDDPDATDPPAAVEIPEGGERFRFDPKTGQRHQLGGLSQLVYAQAVGVCLEACRAGGCDLYPVGVSQWNNGQRKRLAVYRAAAVLGVPEADVDENRADAIGLALWWHAQRDARGDDGLRELFAAR